MEIRQSTASEAKELRYVSARLHELVDVDRRILSRRQMLGCHCIHSL